MKIRLLLAGLCLSSNVHAEIISDIALLEKLGEQLVEMRRQYEMLQKTYQNAESQLNGLQKLQDLNSGNYGFGNLNNSLADLKNRQWSANTWDEALKNISGGNPSRYQELVKAYEKSHITLDDASFLKGATTERLKQYQQNKAVNEAVSVQATYAYNEINQHLKAIHELSAHIEKTPNTKAAVDLNSRLIAELAFIQTEQLKLQTLIGQQSAMSSFNDISSETDMARFNRLPDE
ncbi:vir protein B5 [Legionella quinlivanii]|uniref:Vir protein B5 n=1 Tax=Legionella quinlivanii TaxID=45073 RepID=A0A0W0XTL1_9GAMM|nr:type IV secretion system protein [Legionella quinlivanii]KTD47893.1 vir protein B5 [Legionella quinlivanii]SEG37201.1 type IV secretion system protein VirB5 [Legionella quinlivanii DSM 21216]STY10113.1 protein LvhB5 [Legionella quinlivanii]